MYISHIFLLNTLDGRSFMSLRPYPGMHPGNRRAFSSVYVRRNCMMCLMVSTVREPTGNLPVFP